MGFAISTRHAKKEPFEPIKFASLKYITWKTVFLIAITTFRRCGDLQSLRLGEGSVIVQKKGVTFLRHGLSKQDRVSHQSPKILFQLLKTTRYWIQRELWLFT